MPNRIELQNKGKGYSKNPTTGKSQGPGTTHKGIAREIREAKRTEAETRNADTVTDKRRSFWRERGFTRQSQAASLVTRTVSEVNEQAKIHKQRSEDWPMIKNEIN